MTTTDQLWQELIDQFGDTERFFNGKVGVKDEAEASDFFDLFLDDTEYMIKQARKNKKALLESMFSF